MNVRPEGLPGTGIAQARGTSLDPSWARTLSPARGGTARLSPTEGEGMGPTSVMDLAIAERRDLADLLATLTPEQ